MIIYSKFGIKPLLFSKNLLYASKGYDLLVSDNFGNSFKKIGSFKKNFFLNLFSKIPIISRIFRMAFFYLDIDSNNNLIAIVDGALIIKTKNKKNFNTLFSFPRGSRPLNFSLDNKSNLVWGEYFSNKNRDSVFIYHSTFPYNSFKIKYKFKKNEIRHVHKIFYDISSSQYYVLTGDYGQESGIWKSKDYLNTLKPIIRGSQKARSVSLIIENDRIIGSTDTQLEQNYLYYIDKFGDQILTKEIMGPCFDLIKINDFYLASSIVEKSKFNLTNKVFLYGSIDGVNWVQIDSFLKDIYPISLQAFFQFSVLSIVRSYDIKNEYVFFYGMGIKKYSSSLLRIKTKTLKDLILKNIQLHETNYTRP